MGVPCIYVQMMQQLFSSHSLAPALDAEVGRAREEIERLQEDYLLSAAEEDLVLAIAEKAKWKPPVLGEPYIASDREVEIRKHTPLWDEVYTVKGFEITFRILLQVIELSLE